MHPLPTLERHRVPSCRGINFSIYCTSRDLSLQTWLAWKTTFGCFVLLHCFFPSLTAAEFVNLKNLNQLLLDITKVFLLVPYIIYIFMRQVVNECGFNFFCMWRLLFDMSILLCQSSWNFFEWVMSSTCSHLQQEDEIGLWPNYFMLYLSSIWKDATLWFLSLSFCWKIYLHWTGQFVVKIAYTHRAIEIENSRTGKSITSGLNTSSNFLNMQRDLPI